MKYIYHLFDDNQFDDELEHDCTYCEAFFSEEGELLQSWHENDANWRGEYMDPLLEALGYKVVYSPPDRKKNLLRN